MTYAALFYRQSVAEAQRVSYCESTDNPRASNGNDFGLWQFLPSTWAEPSNPYRRRSYWDARWSSLAAMRMWSRGEQSQWECY